MDLSPNDIRNYEFPSQMRGYDKEEVDTFLEQIAAAMENTRQENLKLSMEVDSLKTQLAGLRQFEDTIKSAAIDARRNADTTMADAKEEADELLSRAKEESETLIGSQATRLDAIKAQLESLELTKRSFIGQIRTIINEHSQLVDDIAEADVKKNLTDDSIEVTDSADVTRETHETIADEGTEEEAIHTEEANAAEEIVPVAEAEAPAEETPPADAEKKPIDPELAAALECYQLQQAAKEAAKDEGGTPPEVIPKPGEFVETTARAEDVPNGFIAMANESGKTEKTTDTDKVAVAAAASMTERNSVDIDEPVLKKKPAEPIDPDQLADALDDVVATFEEQMDKAEKS